MDLNTILLTALPRYDLGTNGTCTKDTIVPKVQYLSLSVLADLEHYSLLQLHYGLLDSRSRKVPRGQVLDQALRLFAPELL